MPKTAVDLSHRCLETSAYKKLRRVLDLFVSFPALVPLSSNWPLQFHPGTLASGVCSFWFNETYCSASSYCGQVERNQMSF